MYSYDSAEFIIHWTSMTAYTNVLFVQLIQSVEFNWVIHRLRNTIWTFKIFVFTCLSDSGKI